MGRWSYALSVLLVLAQHQADAFVPPGFKGRRSTNCFIGSFSDSLSQSKNDDSDEDGKNTNDSSGTPRDGGSGMFQQQQSPSSSTPQPANGMSSTTLNSGISAQQSPPTSNPAGPASSVPYPQTPVNDNVNGISILPEETTASSQPQLTPLNQFQAADPFFQVASIDNVTDEEVAEALEYFIKNEKDNEDFRKMTFEERIAFATAAVLDKLPDMQQNAAPPPVVAAAPVATPPANQVIAPQETQPRPQPLMAEQLNKDPVNNNVAAVGRPPSSATEATAGKSSAAAAGWPMTAPYAESLRDVAGRADPTPSDNDPQSGGSPGGQSVSPTEPSGWQPGAPSEEAISELTNLLNQGGIPPEKPFMDALNSALGGLQKPAQASEPANEEHVAGLLRDLASDEVQELMKSVSGTNVIGSPPEKAAPLTEIPGSSASGDFQTPPLTEDSEATNTYSHSSEEETAGPKIGGPKSDFFPGSQSPSLAAEFSAKNASTEKDASPGLSRGMNPPFASGPSLSSDAIGADNTSDKPPTGLSTGIQPPPFPSGPGLSSDKIRTGQGSVGPPIGLSSGIKAPVSSGPGVSTDKISDKQPIGRSGGINPPVSSGPGLSSGVFPPLSSGPGLSSATVGADKESGKPPNGLSSGIKPPLSPGPGLSSATVGADKGNGKSPFGPSSGIMPPAFSSRSGSSSEKIGAGKSSAGPPIGLSSGIKAPLSSGPGLSFPKTSEKTTVNFSSGVKPPSSDKIGSDKSSDKEAVGLSSGKKPPSLSSGPSFGKVGAGKISAGLPIGVSSGIKPPLSSGPGLSSDEISDKTPVRPSSGAKPPSASRAGDLSGKTESGQVPSDWTPGLGDDVVKDAATSLTDSDPDTSEVEDSDEVMSGQIDDDLENSLEVDSDSETSEAPDTDEVMSHRIDDGLEDSVELNDESDSVEAALEDSFDLDEEDDACSANDNEASESIAVEMDDSMELDDVDASSSLCDDDKTAESEAEFSSELDDTSGDRSKRDISTEEDDIDDGFLEAEILSESLDDSWKHDLSADEEEGSDDESSLELSVEEELDDEEECSDDESAFELSAEEEELDEDDLDEEECSDDESTLELSAEEEELDEDDENGPSSNNVEPELTGPIGDGETEEVSYESDNEKSDQRELPTSVASPEADDANDAPTLASTASEISELILDRSEPEFSAGEEDTVNSKSKPLSFFMESVEGADDASRKRGVKERIAPTIAAALGSSKDYGEVRENLIDAKERAEKRMSQSEYYKQKAAEKISELQRELEGKLKETQELVDKEIVKMMQMLEVEIELEGQRESQILDFQSSLRDSIISKEEDINYADDIADQMAGLYENLKSGPGATQIFELMQEKRGLAAADEKILKTLKECYADMSAILRDARARAARTKRAKEKLVSPEERQGAAYEWEDVESVVELLDEATDSVIDSEARMQDLRERVNAAFVDKSKIRGEAVPEMLKKTGFGLSSGRTGRTDALFDTTHDVVNLKDLEDKNESELLGVLGSALGKTATGAAKAAAFGLKAIFDAVTDEEVSEAGSKVIEKSSGLPKRISDVSGAVKSIKSPKDLASNEVLKDSAKTTGDVLGAVGETGIKLVSSVGKKESAQEATNALKETTQDLRSTINAVAALTTKYLRKKQDREKKSK